MGLQRLLGRVRAHGGIKGGFGGVSWRVKRFQMYRGLHMLSGELHGNFRDRLKRIQRASKRLHRLSDELAGKEGIGFQRRCMAFQCAFQSVSKVFRVFRGLS